ncbi:MAG TPA: nucleoside phosphorylase [Stellaceae bacterium]|nr:nucleoside phosphorylase [Stellaceae bacterium]
MRIAAVTGLAAEARIAGRAGLIAAAAGGDAAHTMAAAERLIAEGADALVSFGICGGLEPTLMPGSLVLAGSVRDETGRRSGVDAAWHRRVAATLAARSIAAVTGDLLGVAAIVATPERKAALHRATGAVAADLETHIAAAAAAKAGLPFLALRAIADPAWRALPPAALVELDASGRPALAAVLRSVLRKPGQIPALLRVALDARAALGMLEQAAGALLPPR